MADITLENAAQKFRNVIQLLRELNDVALSAMEAHTDTINVIIDLRAAMDEKRRLQNWILEHMPEFFD